VEQWQPGDMRAQAWLKYHDLKKRLRKEELDD
jgi:hypothetical protein